MNSSATEQAFRFLQVSFCDYMGHRNCIGHLCRCCFDALLLMLLTAPVVVVVVVVAVDVGGGAVRNRPNEKLSLVYFEVLSIQTSL